MATGLTDDDLRQIQKFAQTPRHRRTPELLCSKRRGRRDEDGDSANSAQSNSDQSNSAKNSP
ncbi:hypothetical protein [Haladaptatus cibarius]|uniref:hypothetical protein n=1 Tax=Haladaptatus cibarius TaxID=453847 RepID=UPI0006791E37|nr:hypothetical protein [Haladaptatus cibarius]